MIAVLAAKVDTDAEGWFLDMTDLRILWLKTVELAIRDYATSPIVSVREEAGAFLHSEFCRGWFEACFPEDRYDRWENRLPELVRKLRVAWGLPRDPDT